MYVYIHFLIFFKAHCFIFNRLNLFIRGPKVGFTSPSWVMGEGLGKGFLKILKVYTSMYLTILLWGWDLFSVLNFAEETCSRLKVSCSGIAPGSGKDCLCTWIKIQWRTLTRAFAWLRIAAVFFHMSLSWMCSNKIILKQAVDIQWFINTFCWVLRPLIFYQECTPSRFLERSVEDRCNGCTSGLVVAPLQLPSQCESRPPLWILFSGCLAAEFVVRDKDSRLKWMMWWEKVEGARQDQEDNSLKEQSRRRDKGSQI